MGLLKRLSASRASKIIKDPFSSSSSTPLSPASSSSSSRQCLGKNGNSNSNGNNRTSPRRSHHNPQTTETVSSTGSKKERAPAPQCCPISPSSTSTSASNIADRMTSTFGETMEASLVHLRLRGLPVDCKGCPVCFDLFEVGRTVTYLPCGHLYHSSCLFHELQRKTCCLTCDYDLKQDQATKIISSMKASLRNMDNHDTDSDDDDESIASFASS